MKQTIESFPGKVKVNLDDLVKAVFFSIYTWLNLSVEFLQRFGDRRAAVGDLPYVNSFRQDGGLVCGCNKFTKQTSVQYSDFPC